MVERILLVEDDPRLADMLVEYLGQAGFSVMHASLGTAALEKLDAAAYDAVVLDLMLPDMDGLDVCRQLRARYETPVLMLTARGDAVDRIVGLEIGADDYLPKPFEPRELVARIRAILRRSRNPRGDEGEDEISVGDVTLSLRRRTVSAGGAALEVTAVEFNLLECLLRNAGQVVSREQLAEKA